MLKPFPFALANPWPSAIGLNGKIYVFDGGSDLEPGKDVYEYDIAADGWKKSVPLATGWPHGTEIPTKLPIFSANCRKSA